MYWENAELIFEQRLARAQFVHARVVASSILAFAQIVASTLDRMPANEKETVMRKLSAWNGESVSERVRVWVSERVRVRPVRGLARG